MIPLVLRIMKIDVDVDVKLSKPLVRPFGSYFGVSILVTTILTYLMLWSTRNMRHKIEVAILDIMVLMNRGQQSNAS